MKKIDIIRPVIHKVSVITKGAERNFVSLKLTASYYNEDHNVVKSATETYYDEPLKRFFSAMDAMLPWAMATAHLSEDWDENGFVSGLTIKDDGCDVCGYCATVQYRDPDTGAVQCVSTRYKPLEECNPKEIEGLEAVRKACTDYLNGDRAAMQLSLLEGAVA